VSLSGSGRGEKPTLGSGVLTYSFPMLMHWRQRVERITRLGISDADTTDERIYKEAVNLSALIILVLACFG
jgi:hypothetical protein